MAILRVQSSAQPKSTRLAESVSVVIPCLNEEPTLADAIGSALELVASLDAGGEVIVVDNGSTDRSVEIAEELGARVIREEERGCGAALRAGFAAAKGGYVVMGDGDATYQFQDALPMLLDLDAGADMCVGNRFRGGIDPEAMDWSHRYIGTPALSALLRVTCGSKLGDSQCGLRALRRSALERLNLQTSGMELASEMILRAYRSQLVIREQPATLRVRRGEAKLATFRDGWRHLSLILAASPTMLFTIPGLTLLMAGIALTVLAFVSGGGVVAGSSASLPAFLSSVCLVLGLYALGIGALAAQLAARDGLGRPDRVMRTLLRWLSPNRLVLVGALAGLSGVGIRLALLVVNGEGGAVGPTVSLASLSHSLMIAGAGTVWLGFMTSLVASHLFRSMARPAPRIDRLSEAERKLAA